MAEVTAAPPVPPSFTVHAVHLVRTATQTNLALSQMADQKASILMGATFVVFTIAVGQASRGDFPLSLLVLACCAFLSALFAVAAILPSISPPAASPDTENDTENILFFGVFTRFSEEEFANRVLQRLASDEAVFRTMLRDIYQNGQVLQRKKYRFLGWAYRIFIAGLTLTLVTFLLESREALQRII